MPAPKTSLKEEAIRLRKEERLSYREIRARIKVSKGSLSSWLANFPLTPEEQKASRRHFTYGRTKPETGHSKFSAMVKEEQLSSDQKMRIAESAALFRMALTGFRTFRSTSDNDRSDFVVVTESKRSTIQVKWCQRGKYGGPFIPLRRSTGENRGKLRYEPGEFDFIVGYDLLTDTCFVYSEKEVKEHQNSITVEHHAAEAWAKMK